MRWGSNHPCRNLQSAGSELFSLSLPKGVFPETKRIQKHKQVLKGASRAPSSPPQTKKTRAMGRRHFADAFLLLLLSWP